ncbi:hypothetical protein EVAR_37694_1 [Eumeta japonica]|uniref:Uncharacterized protein n=1 Tax=Eumeta variegata TaxID=151549 RepID=A0A4C1XV01_EUMVA|nr:hypothetical protein EVAR_37694_1 [Eumeta japonica]
MKPRTGIRTESRIAIGIVIKIVIGRYIKWRNSLYAHAGGAADRRFSQYSRGRGYRDWRTRGDPTLINSLWRSRQPLGIRKQLGEHSHRSLYESIDKDIRVPVDLGPL